MSSSRFFVTNLPQGTTEDDLRSLFQEYGPVTLVDLKTKENALDPGQINIFAFVTVAISSEDAEYYIHELKWKKLHGANIKISLAKESFLERLKRERAENEVGASSNLDPNLEATESQKRTEAFPESLQNTRRIFAEDGDIDEDISSDLLITKKRAARSMQNGKIVIEESGAAPLHVIEKQRKIKHDSTAKKGTTAEQKRKESMNKMKNQYEQKKSAIQEALSGLNNPKSTKIKFSDAEEDTDEEEPKSKTDIFGLNDENDEDITDLKLLYGKKGDKLAKLKSQNQSIDPRFKMNEKFVEDDEGSDADKDDEKSADSETDERNWQLNILEQVVGYKIDKTTAAEKASKNKKMVRFDPSKSDHQKLLRQKVSENKTETEVLDEVQQPKATPVSKEVFYVVSDTFAEALKNKSEGFSLLNMFGSQVTSAELEQREDHLNQLKDERILVNKLNKNVTSAIQYESSSSGEDDEEVASNKVESVAESKKQKQIGKKAKIAILKETFFFNKNDERLKEGALFFQYDKLDKIAEEDYEPVRRKLNTLIKKKILKTRKNQFGAVRKGMRNKKKV